MKRTLLLVAALLVAPAAFGDDPTPGAELAHRQFQLRFEGARHMILEPQHALRPHEAEALAAAGVEVQKAMTGGRYMVRVAKDSTVDDNHPIVRSLKPLRADQKVHRSAVSAAARGVTMSRLNVIFHEDVTVEAARAAVERAGGMLAETFALEFQLPRRLEVLLPSSSIDDLAADERVLSIYGRMPKIIGDNVTSANLSRVTEVHQAPYNLSGEGVVLAYFEPGAADTTHREFEGRNVSHDTGGGDANISHATHVGGTMIAAGINPQAKGMAPKATLHAYRTRGETNFLNHKQNTLPGLNAVGDNNSWGYILGWCTEPNCSNWVWTGNDELYGGYIYLNAALDNIARNSPVLMVHSAGNDANKRGPTQAPFQHHHTDPETGDPVYSQTYCYSENGSGTDCVAPCTTGSEFCEVTRHPVNAPWNSVGLTASSKNVIAVAATDSSRVAAPFSSRGPARDGRVKPDVAARGFNTFSTDTNGGYGTKNGTSMAAPVVTGVTGLLVEQWRKSNGGASPGNTTVKALLIAGAEDLGVPGPDYIYGHGFVNAKNSADLIIADGGSGSRVKVQTIQQGGTLELPINVGATQNLRVVAVWTDPEALSIDSDELAGDTLINDIDIKVVAPDGSETFPYLLNKDQFEAPATKGVNRADNVEVVEIANAGAGTYRLIISGTRMGDTSSPRQQFTLVSTAPLGSAAAPCTDLNEPNDTAATAFGFLTSGASVTGRNCAANDVDFYKFRVERAGAVQVRVTATDTPIRATLIAPGGASTSVDVGANSTQTVTTNVGTGTNPLNPMQEFLLRIEPTGAIGTSATYTFTPTFGTLTPARRPAVRR